MATIGKLRNGNVIILFKKNEMAKIEIEKIVKTENKKKQINTKYSDKLRSG